MKATMNDDGTTSIQFSDAEWIVMVLKFEYLARKAEPWVAQFDQFDRYRLVASTMNKLWGPIDVLTMFGGDDPPPGGEKIERHLKLAFSADRKAA